MDKVSISYLFLFSRYQTKCVIKDYLRCVSKYSLFDPNIAIIYEKDNLYKHFSLVCLYILACFSGHLC